MTRRKKKAPAKKVTHSRFNVRWLLMLLLKITLLVFCLLAIYLIYLDSKVTRLFSGQKWQVPAQVYARTLELYPGKHLTVKQLVTELDQLRYQNNSRLNAAGQYHVAGNKVTILRRPFSFADGFENSIRFTVEFNRDGINRILQQNNAIDFARLEPQLIEHLVSAEQEDRELVRLEQVPEIIKDTLLLVEDRHFYHHSGVSPLAILRAFWVNITAGRTVQGGSTLTQQLAKNMYLSSDRTLWRKINEAFIALILEYRYSKDQILEAYLNEIFIGQNYANAVHGVGLGSRFYFGKPLAELEPAEYALLIGILKGPSYYDPRRYPERAQQRRDLVLKLMFEQHLLDRKLYQQSVEQPLQLVARGQHRHTGVPAYMDAVKKELRQLNLDESLLQSGIKVFTYLDPQAQSAASQAVTALPSGFSTDTQLAMVVADYRHGQIKAVIGDRENTPAGFNRAIDARRQIGSIIKPVIYLEALSQPQRFTLATLLDDSPVSLRSNKQMWQPQNFDKQFRGPVHLVDALAQSLNVPTVRLGLQLGLPAVHQGLHKLGLNRRVNLHPSALLGTIELSPLEVTQLYQTLANNGVHHELTTLHAVTDQDGYMLYQHNEQPTVRYHPDEVYLLQYALIKATKQGTARALSRDFPGVTLAGKTGTSSDYRDSWFSGFDQDSLVTVWLGKDDNTPIGLTGSTGALTVFSRYLKTSGSYSLLNYMPEKVSLQAFSEKNGYQISLNCLNVLLLPAISVEMPVASNCED